MENDQNPTPALWMCYAGGAGFGGYAGYNDYIRRLRIFEVDMNEARIKTWKRLEYGDTEARIDEQIIIDGGKPKAIPLPQTEAQAEKPPAADIPAGQKPQGSA